MAGTPLGASDGTSPLTLRLGLAACIAFLAGSVGGCDAADGGRASAQTEDVEVHDPATDFAPGGGLQHGKNSQQNEGEEEPESAVWEPDPYELVWIDTSSCGST